MPSVNFTPWISFGNWLWPSSRRQVFCAASTSLNTIASAVLFERQPFERIVRCRTVAKVLSIGFEVAAHEDLAAAVRWAQANIVQYGGDPDRLALWGTSAGADLIAGYLGHPQFHGPKGHGVKAAIMLSGFYEKGVPAYFGNDPAERAERLSTEGLKKVTIPLFVSQTEVDLPTSSEQADILNKALCDAGRCPTYMVFKDHNHLSQAYSVGTTDTSVSGPIL